MFAIVGLGNSGEKYQRNRHNVGQIFIDYLFSELTLQSNLGQAGFRVNEFKFDKYSNSQLAKLAINNKELLLVKPQTFMNKSGLAVKKITATYNLQPTNLVIVHDDLDIPLGKFKIQKGTGPQLHNGIESIEQHLKTKYFWRIRIGVENRKPIQWIDGQTYVLNDFLPAEKQILKEVFSKILLRLKSSLPKSC